jgi:hypothetical protein
MKLIAVIGWLWRNSGPIEFETWRRLEFTVLEA